MRNAMGWKRANGTPRNASDAEAADRVQHSCELRCTQALGLDQVDAMGGASLTVQKHSRGQQVVGGGVVLEGGDVARAEVEAQRHNHNVGVVM